MSMLEVERLRVWYGAAQILFEPSFHVGRGEVVALMGRNGAGKSTTLKALMALIPQRSGMVRFLGEDIDYILYQYLGCRNDGRHLGDF